MLEKKGYVLLIFGLMFGLVLGIPLGDSSDVVVGLNHLSHNTADDYLYPTNTSLDFNLSGNELLDANLSSYAGTNISWSLGQFHVSADGTSKWSDDGSTLFTGIDGRDVQVNGTINGTDGEFSDDLHVGDDIWCDDLHVDDDLWCDVAYTRTVGVESSVYHIGDADTFFHFNTDELYFNIDGFKVLELLNATSTFYNNVIMSRNLTVSDTVTADSFVGDGSGLTGIISGLWSEYGNTISPLTSGRKIVTNSSINCTGANITGDTNITGNLTVDENISMIGNSTISATENITIGNPGDIVLGDDTERDMYPNTTGKMNLGTATHKFNDGWFSGKLDVTGGVDPPYVLFNKESLYSIINRIDYEVPKDEDHKFDGLALWGDGVNMFALNPKSGHQEQFVWKSDYDLLEERVDRLERLVEEMMK